MDTLFVAWQDPESREWIPVGRLTRGEGMYKFAYTRGATRSKHFQTFGLLNDLHSTYESKNLFPVFANRVITKSRPEYKDYLRWIGRSDLDTDPMTVLGLTGGIRGTDSIQLFPLPERLADGRFCITFFARGLRHLEKSALDVIAELSPGTALKLTKDCQNDFDVYALCLTTMPPQHRNVGYCPKYWASDVSRFLDADRLSVQTRVKRVNLDAPLDMRLLCTVTVPWAGDGDLFSSHEDFHLIGREELVA